MQATSAVLVAVMALAAPAGAQSSAKAPPAPPATAQPAPSVDASRLGVNLSRIQRRLQSSTERQSHDALNLRFYVDVYAMAPPIVLLSKEDNLNAGRVPDSAPTHQDMLRFMTPRDLQAPPTGRLPSRSKK
jgi:hypothetical protein